MEVSARVQTGVAEVTSRSLPSRREWILAFLVTLITVGVTSIPYALGYLTARDGWVFMGVLMNPEDTQSYFAKMLQGYDGNLLYTIPFTFEPHSGAFIGAFYMWLGQLARLVGVSIEVIWQLARIVADVILFLVTFGFVSTFLTETRARWTAYFLSLFGSGLGWVLFLLNQLYWLGAFPVDFKQPGAHLFFMALTFPHVALGTALTMIIFWFLLRLSIGNSFANLSWKVIIPAGMATLLLGIAYPFLVYLPAASAILYWLFLSWRARQPLWFQGSMFAITFAIPAPLYIYYAYTLRTNVVFRAWDAQAGTPALPWPHYLLAFGPMLLLAFTQWRNRPSSRRQFPLLWLWILAAALLLYAPFGPQRRFVQGVHVPLSILSTAGFLNIVLPWLRRTRPWHALIARPRYSAERLSRLVIVLFLAFMSLSNLYVIASVSVSAVVQQPDTLFRPTDEVEATAWLRANVEQTVVVMADYLTGNYVAARAGQRVVLGHWAETVDYAEKVSAVARFYSIETADDWRRDLLSKYLVDYVWYGPRERELGGFDPGSATYLHPVHASGNIEIYAVHE
jgi:hypothetical protein